MPREIVLMSSNVDALATLVDESVRASRDGVRYFIEPTSGVLAKAKNKRHHIVFGRRGSGKSSLLQKVASDLTINRTPIAFVDLESFKGHSYPDVLVSILIKSISEVKGTNVWLKVGTIRHRSIWYTYGDPPIGMKLGDDADEIDLDVTLEKYEPTRIFLQRILAQFAKIAGVTLNDILADGARDRLVLASGGVARDFLTIFAQSLIVARDRIELGNLTRGEKIGAEDVNIAAGHQGQFKEEDFSRDSGEDRDRLLSEFSNIYDFCLQVNANCFLVEKDISSSETSSIDELVDLKLLHRARSRVTIRHRNRKGRLYDAFMLDLSRYTGERARRNFELVKFWGPDAEDSLRRATLIFLERPITTKDNDQLPEPGNLE